METMEASSMEGVSAAMEAAPMETSHAAPMEASAAKAATAVKASASAAKAAARRGDIWAQHPKQGQRQQGYCRSTKHHSLPLMRSPVAAIGAASDAIAFQHRKPVLHASQSVSLTSPRPGAGVSNRGNRFLRRIAPVSGYSAPELFLQTAINV
jgi:hypothetical protein